MVSLDIANNIYSSKGMLKLTDEKLIKSASYLSVSMALIIMLIKTYGWLYTDSQSIFASLVDSMLDISASLINLIAVKLSMQPPDDNHRFGHEKFEDLAVFSQSIFFFASCIFILFSSCKALFFIETVENTELGADIMYICILLTLLLVCYQSFVVYKTKSIIIAADKLHYFSDFLTNIAVVATLHLSKSYWFIDPIAGILIALYIIRGSYILFRKAIRNLADEEFPQKDKLKILEIVRSHSGSRGVHELKTRYAGNKPFIQFHLEMDASLSLRKAHSIAEEITDNIIASFPLAEVIIHQDPEGEETDVNYREEI